MTDAYDIIKKKYGVNVSFRENRVTDVVKTTTTTLAYNNPNRLGLIIINLGAYNVYVAPSPDVSSSKGILLAPNGGGISFDINEDFMLPSLEWYGIAETADCNVYVLEVISV